VSVALLTPAGAPSVQGNAITVDRIARGLAGRGVAARVWDLSGAAAADVLRQVVAWSPRLVHAFNAFRAGPLALEAARRLSVPCVVTLTGTDVNHDLVAPERAAVVRHVLDGAAAITVFHRVIAARVADALPGAAPRVVEIPQAVRFSGADPIDLDARWLPAGRLLFLFAGGIRRVKNPLLALHGLEPVAGRHPEVRLAYAGPVLEEAEDAALRRALASRPWARSLGPIPHRHMASLLAQTDVVVNCSLSEGGMPNSVLEALALERAVLASAVEGNRALIEHDVTGLLFRDQAELAAHAERLVVDPGLRARLGRAGRARVERDYPAEREIDAYLALYRRLAGSLAEELPRP
jgi:glycosyltransferase involved in cell wall biosynthesis